MEGEVPEISGHDLVGTALAHLGKVATGKTKPDPLRIHLLLRPYAQEAQGRDERGPAGDGVLEEHQRGDEGDEVARVVAVPPAPEQAAGRHQTHDQRHEPVDRPLPVQVAEPRRHQLRRHVLEVGNTVNCLAADLVIHAGGLLGQGRPRCRRRSATVGRAPRPLLVVHRRAIARPVADRAHLLPLQHRLLLRHGDKIVLKR